MKNAHVSISRPSYSDGKERIKISIGDRDSSLRLIELEMTYDEFTRALTGVASSPAEVRAIIGVEGFKNLGKIRKTKTVECAKVSYKKDEQREEVLRDFAENYEPDGWELGGDGCDSQQHGEKHHYHVRKFVTPEEHEKEMKDFVL